MPIQAVSPDVGLVDSDEAGMHGEGDGRQVKVIKEERDMGMEAAGGVKLQANDSRGNAVDTRMRGNDVFIVGGRGG